MIRPVATHSATADIALGVTTGIMRMNKLAFCLLFYSINSNLSNLYNQTNFLRLAASAFICRVGQIADELVDHRWRMKPRDQSFIYPMAIYPCLKSTRCCTIKPAEFISTSTEFLLTYMEELGQQVQPIMTAFSMVRYGHCHCC